MIPGVDNQQVGYTDAEVEMGFIARAVDLLSIRFVNPAHSPLWGVEKPLRDGSTGYFARRPDDCWYASCATVLQVPLRDFPETHIIERVSAGEAPEEINRSNWRTLRGWLAGRGLEVVAHPKAPVDAERWIGVVPIAGWFASHSLVMSRDAVLFDPMGDPLRSFRTPDGNPRVVKHWRPEDVRFGFTFEPLAPPEATNA